MHCEGAAPYDSSGAVSAGSLGDMEAKEEAQAADSSLPEREATALEPEPASPSSPGELGSGSRRPGPGLLGCPPSLPLHMSRCPPRTQVSTCVKWALC